MTALQQMTFVLGRLLLAFIFVLEGWLKITDYSGTLAYMEAHGVSGGLLPAAIVAELGGGLAIACGLLIPLAAPGLALYCILTATLFHWDFSDPGQTLHFYKDLTIAGGFLVLAASGPGAFSLDAWLARAGRRPL